MFYMFGEMITPVILLPPIFFLYGKKNGYTAERTILCFLLSIYLAFVFHLTGQPDLLYHRFEPNIYLIPFGEVVTDFKNSILNILLFVPFGFLLPTLDSKYRVFYKTVIFGICFSVFIELSQMFTLRATDINDVITNTLGSAVGWWIWSILRNKLSGLCAEDRGKDILFCGIISYAVMFFIQPFTYHFLWTLIMK